MRFRSLLLPLLAGLASADVCDTIRGTTDITVKDRWSLTFIKENLGYWSTRCAGMTPSCMIIPTTVEQVSQAMQLLSASGETFAIKSGGHNSNCGWSSVDGGPLLFMGEFNEVTLDKETETVRLGGGQKWGNVMEKLDGTGYAVVGGRMSDVGVGGFILGGGLSFLSTQYGWAANNVVEYELVLANGTTTKASADTNSDLFQALRGGGNNFGIVTTFVVKAHPIGKVWGGNYFFGDSPDTEKRLLAAMRDFAEYYPDPKAGVILTRQMGLGVVHVWTMFLFYDGEAPPAGLFDNFTAVDPVADTTKARSYRDFIDTNNWGSSRGLVFTIGTETFPNPDADHGAEVYSAVHSKWYAASKSIQDVVGAVGVIAYQPIPRVMARAARDRGGDMLALDDAADRIVLDINYGHLLPAQYDRIDATMVQTIEGIGETVRGLTAEGKLPDVARPLFMNDGFHTQDIFGRYGAKKKELAQKVSAAVDPEGILQKRTGGFKV
ncbi:hypothetical protein BROUX41_003296 [Berkeleyomyces rouxiae]|uniref:uncharacterized protein n=1 Tax=Berkeleyomyces rouxiae TaxID=2035830 RepID=UPI003B7A01AF